MSKVKYDKTAKVEWDKRTKRIVPGTVDTIPFARVLQATLPRNEEFNCLEIGAIPGNFLVYMHKQFNYKITGIDFSKSSNKFHETMQVNEIKDYNFIKADFLRYKFSEQFDVVCSFGFIEHFDNLEEVIDKHCALVADAGYLVLEVPNFRYFQYLYHYVFDKPNLDIHNTDAMRPKLVSDIVRRNGFKVLHVGYTGGIGIWDEGTLKNRLLTKINNKLKPFINSKKPKSSRLYSPFILMIYKRDE